MIHHLVRVILLKNSGEIICKEFYGKGLYQLEKCCDSIQEMHELREELSKNGVDAISITFGPEEYSMSVWKKVNDIGGIKV